MVVEALNILFERAKSLGVNNNEQEVEALANLFECMKGDLPMKYLGMPLGANPRRAKTWQPIADRVSKKMPFGKLDTFLSEGGSLLLSQHSVICLYTPCHSLKSLWWWQRN